VATVAVDVMGKLVLMMVPQNIDQYIAFLGRDRPAVSHPLDDSAVEAGATTGGLPRYDNVGEIFLNIKTDYFNL